MLVSEFSGLIIYLSACKVPSLPIRLVNVLDLKEVSAEGIEYLGVPGAVHLSNKLARDNLIKILTLEVRNWVQYLSFDMSLLFVVSVGFSLSRVCIMVIQPLRLGFMLIIITLCVRVLIGMVIFSWYGYLLFLVYIGGLLVMFMYVIRLIPNLIFLSRKVSMYFFIILCGFLIINFFVTKELVRIDIKDFSLFDYSSMRLAGGRTIIMYDNFLCYLLLGLILLFVLIRVVKICYYCEGPLRVFKFK